MATSQLQLVLKRHQQFGKSGDRAARETEYWSHQVCLRHTSGELEDFVLREWPGYDPNNSSIVYAGESSSLNYVIALAAHMGLPEAVEETYRLKITKTWELVE